MKIEKVSAFAMQDGSGGNPAGVTLLKGGIDPAQMQSAATEVGYSETAFIERLDERKFRLRFYTPNTEIDNCGHATVASFGWMFERGLIGEGEYEVVTNAGDGRVSVEGGRIKMHQTPGTAVALDSERVLASLGISANQVATTFSGRASTGVPFYVLAVLPGSLASLRPDFDAIMEASKQLETIGYYVYEWDNARVFKTRMFAPLYGIEEESATGMAAGALAFTLAQQKTIEPDEYQILQGLNMNSPAEIRVNVAKDFATSGVTISGRWRIES